MTGKVSGDSVTRDVTFQEYHGVTGHTVHLARDYYTRGKRPKGNKCVCKVIGHTVHLARDYYTRFHCMHK